MVELEAQVQETLGVGRDVRGYRGLRAERTDLQTRDIRQTPMRAVRTIRYAKNTLKMACIWLS
jgi:hypothetical protein